MFISTWVLLVAGLVFAFPMIHMRVQDHTDETLDDLYVSIFFFLSFYLSLFPSLPTIRLLFCFV
jgi:hypothetical protein